ncbi:actin filament-associated protein 1-like 2 isoform X2 [Brienomyrus brachyistius]|uniref:actin filament-associated protein 1-like 2 isoform X2 n=1 Tax=Brienomyrus brachyistius TaxID=42636 RepID=UPI0020B205A8|nr:actin filament-associated protein 1-like 2 isoform X2 [Brienomyrus brachyistius]
MGSTCFPLRRKCRSVSQTTYPPLERPLQVDLYQLEDQQRGTEEHVEVLDRLLGELERFLMVLDRENLSSEATVQKSLLSDLLKDYLTASGVNSASDEEYIYMNKVLVSRPAQEKSACDRANLLGASTTSREEKPPLPSLPQPLQCSLFDSPEGYYEEAQPYDTATNDDGEAVSSSYESYDEDEAAKGRSAAQHQWPSTEASIELMKDARICAFLWRKKWLGQWAKQLCVIKEQRLLCYKSSKDQNPQLEVSLLGCTVVYKEKQVKKKEHKLKVVPVGGEAIVLGLQSKEQAEQWYKVIQEISGKPLESPEVAQHLSDSPRQICSKGELSERHSAASESGSSTDSHAEAADAKEGKKRYGAALKLSNLMNIGKKKPSALESPEKTMETSGYLNVLANSQWRTRWCTIKNGQLWFYQDKGKTKVAQQPVGLEGCMVVPDPSPDHLYSFTIQQDGEQLATLEAKSSADMGHWLGLLLSQTGSKTSPEDLTYDYVDSDRISCIVNAAKTSMYLMQRRISEPNAYIDSLSVAPGDPDDIYDNVANTEGELEQNQDSQENKEAHKRVEVSQTSKVVITEQDGDDRIYLDLIPVQSFLHGCPGKKEPLHSREQSPSDHRQEKESASQDVPPPIPEPRPPHTLIAPSQPAAAVPQLLSRPEPESASPRNRVHSYPAKMSLASPEPLKKAMCRSNSPQPHKQGRPSSESLDRPRVAAPAEIKLGKNRTEADVRRFTDERDQLEREKEQVRNQLAMLRGQRKELKEALAAAREPSLQNLLELKLKEAEEACRVQEQKRVDLELQLVDVKENLKKVEAGPFTLGTAVDSGLLDMVKVTTPCTVPVTASANGDAAPINSASTLKNRPLSLIASNKGNVLQKAKEWEKKSTT